MVDHFLRDLVDPKGERAAEDVVDGGGRKAGEDGGFEFWRGIEGGQVRINAAVANATSTRKAK